MSFALKSLVVLTLALPMMCQTIYAAAPQTDPATISRLQLEHGTLIRLEDSSGQANPAIFPDLADDTSKTALVTGQANVCNVFLVQRENSLTMIDSGWGSQGKVQGQTLRLMDSLGIKPAHIRDILITHMHIDHISGLIRDGDPVFPNAVLHIASPEFEYWIVKGADKNPNAVALARNVARAYQDRIKLFDWEAQVLPGIKAESAPGHTPGHTLYTIGQGELAVTVIGDLIHAADLQLAFPEISPIYDIDPKLGATTRRVNLERFANDGRRIAGMHVRDMGRIAHTDQGGFAIRP